MQYRNWYFRGWRSRYAFQRSRHDQSNLQSNLQPILQSNLQQNLQLKQPPILLIHGFGAAIDQWRDNVPALAERHMVYAIDLLGFGGSEKPVTRYSIYLWVEQVFRFWQRFVGVPMVIVGNSIGALVAAIAASQHPEMAAGVVAISLPDIDAFNAMVPKALQPLERTVKEIVAAILVKPLFHLVRQPLVIQLVLKGIVYSDRRRVDEQLVEIIAKPARDRQAADAFVSLNRSLNSPNYSPNLPHALSQLQAPLLILWGKSDRLIPPSEGKRLLPYASNASLIYLDNVGHCAHDDAPMQVNQIILDWIAEIASKKSQNIYCNSID